MTEEDGNKPVGVVATPSLVRPCLQKVAEQLTGRKYAKVQGDLESLLERLDSLMVSEEPRGEGKSGGDNGVVSGQDVSGGETSGEDSMRMSASESSIYGKYSELSMVQSEWSPLADGAARGRLRECGRAWMFGDMCIQTLAAWVETSLAKPVMATIV
eukprot:jgi/Picsp_1/4477/NSC_06698-R1_---NA---